MAYVITKQPDGDLSLGSLSGEVVTLQPAVADYPFGGYSLVGGETANSNGTPNLINTSLWRILTAVPIGGQGGLSPVWNAATQKLQMFGVSTSSNTALGLSAVSGKSTAIGVASGVITVTTANNLTAGQFVYLQSFTAGGALNGLIVQVLTASPTQFTAAYPTPNITAATADVTGTYQVVQVAVGNLLTTGTKATITNSLATTSLLTMTAANTFSKGQFVVIQGLTNGAVANGVIVQIASASATQFTANWTGTAITTGADSGTASLLVTSGNAPVTTGAVATISNSLATASSAGTAGVITLTATQLAINSSPVTTQLGSAANYALLASAGIANTGATTIAGGNIGSYPTTSITGSPTLTPPATTDNTDAAAAQTALAAAIAYYQGLTPTLSGLTNLSTSGNGSTAATYTAGNYFGSTSLTMPTGIILDAQGNANAQFVFVAGSTINLSSGQSITLINGAQAANVVFVAGSAFTSVATSTVNGNILAVSGVTLGGGTLNGRALVTTGPVTISAATAITVATAVIPSNPLVAGNIVVVQGLTNGAGINGDLLTVIPTGLTSTTFEANGKTAAFSSAADSGTASILVTGTQTSGSAQPEIQGGTDLSGYAFNLLLLGY